MSKFKWRQPISFHLREPLQTTLANKSLVVFYMEKQQRSNVQLSERRESLVIMGGQLRTTPEAPWTIKATRVILRSLRGSLIVPSLGRETLVSQTAGVTFPVRVVVWRQYVEIYLSSSKYDHFEMVRTVSWNVNFYSLI